MSPMVSLLRLACSRLQAIFRLMRATLPMPPLALDSAAGDPPWLNGGYFSQTTRRMAERHEHAYGQILGVDEGVIGIRTEQSYWQIGPGQCLWLPPGLPHQARSHGAITGWLLYISEARSQTLSSEPFLTQGSRLLRAQAERLARHASGMIWDKPLFRLAESFWDEFRSLPHAALSLPLPMDPRLRRVADLLSDNPADPREQPDWASDAGMSPRSFVRRFMTETGMPFSTWRRRLRVLAAQELLARGHSVTDAALEVGYESSGAFGAAFRSITGCSPRDYSKLRGGGHDRTS